VMTVERYWTDRKQSLFGRFDHSRLALILE
jgi:hypothetical protein